MSVLIHPSYFSNIATWVAMVKTDDLIFEIQDNYQKQTYRNRAYIYGANGKLSLNVPVNYTQKNRQLTGEIKIAHDGKWQATHWKSLLSAYKTSPFFEFYQDDLYPIFQKKHDYLLDLNYHCFEVVKECLQIDIPYVNSQTYIKDPDCKDLRFLINARKENLQSLDQYTQVFSEKHGFISNLSILDLLFNEGPNALNYLESQSLENIMAAQPSKE